jgi:hypothetical protein
MTVDALSAIEQGADNVLGPVIDPPERSRYGWRTEPRPARGECA